MSNTDMNLNCQSVQARLAASWGYVKPSAVRAGYFAYDAEHNIWEEVSSADAPGAMALYMVGDIPETTGAAAIKLPIDVTIGCVTIKAGCSLQTLLTRIEIINQTWQPKALADPFAASGKLITEQDHIAAPGKVIPQFIPAGIVNDQHSIDWMEEIVEDQAPIGAILYALQDSVGRNVSIFEEAVCNWRQPTYDNFDANYWDADCGKSWAITEGTPTDNGMKFCHGCGKPIKEHPFVDLEDEQ